VKFKRHVVHVDGVDIVVERVNLKHEVVSTVKDRYVVSCLTFLAPKACAKHERGHVEAFNLESS
jgi:hypothetical protein